MLDDRQLVTLGDELKKPGYAAQIAAKDWAGLVSALNAHTTHANPVPQPSRPKLITWGAFMQALTDVDGVKLYDHGALAADMKAALAANDRAMAQDLWRSAKTFLSPASVTAAQAAFNATEPDPAWAATLPDPSAAQGLGLPAVTLEDVQTAIHRQGAG